MEMYVCVRVYARSNQNTPHVRVYKLQERKWKTKFEQFFLSIHVWNAKATIECATDAIVKLTSATIEYIDIRWCSSIFGHRRLSHFPYFFFENNIPPKWNSQIALLFERSFSFPPTQTVFLFRLLACGPHILLYPLLRLCMISVLVAM